MNIFDNIIAWSPHILHFKGLGMKNLQYEMRICQKSHSKVTKTVYVWFEFLWIRRYIVCTIKRIFSYFLKRYISSGETQF